MLDDSVFAIVKKAVEEYTDAQAARGESDFISMLDENTPQIKKDTDGKRFINYFNLVAFDMRLTAPQNLGVLPSGTYSADFALFHRNAASEAKIPWLQDYHTAMVNGVLKDGILKSVFEM